MLHIQINPNTGVPAYRQIMDQIRYYVASSTLAPGDQLPSVRELARQLTVNPSTIVKAYTELEHEGVIENKQGRGTFVAEIRTRLSRREKRTILQRSATHLWVEARQLDMAEEEVWEILREERERMSEEVRA